LIQHVYEAVRACRSIERIIVATDDERIVRAVRSFDGEARMTSPAHPNGTSRIAEAMQGVEAEVVLNVQGDEPEIAPTLLEALIEATRGERVGTLAIPFESEAEAALPNRVKVVVDRSGYALYFSRARVPSAGPALLHLGLYGFERGFLLSYATLPPTPLEEAERLEQLRFLENGVRVRVGIVSGRPHGGIDTAEDYDAFVRRCGGRDS